MHIEGFWGAGFRVIEALSVLVAHPIKPFFIPYIHLTLNPSLCFKLSDDSLQDYAELCDEHGCESSEGPIHLGFHV